jgi:2-polyprenyl-6-methoxyphenol hydroxylase-like FAD-dependent oxidoreductase
MTESAVAIVGSGIVGTAMAYHLANKGFDVEIFEKVLNILTRTVASFARRSSICTTTRPIACPKICNI